MTLQRRSNGDGVSQTSRRSRLRRRVVDDRAGWDVGVKQELLTERNVLSSLPQGGNAVMMSAKFLDLLDLLPPFVTISQQRSLPSFFLLIWNPLPNADVI